MAITTSSTLSAPVKTQFGYKLLSVPTPNFIHKTAAVLKKMKSKGGTDIRYRRYNALPKWKILINTNALLRNVIRFYEE